MTKVSALICCANVADTFGAACRSLSWADELVVVDSGSCDETGDIARRFADRYVREPWRGYTEQKRFGSSLCRNEWVFLLDGDEECSPSLAEEISLLKPEDFERVDVFLMRRRNYVMGRVARALGPDWQSRLFHRDRCHWPDEALHDRRLPSAPSRTRKLRGWLEHKRVSGGGFDEYFDGQLADRRLGLVAEEMLRRGRRCTWIDVALRPAFTFVKFYLLKQGFRDGLFGLLIAQRAACATQLKYAALWGHEDERRRGGDPSP